ncbi:MAG TPA: HAMP domain-containing protein [Planctomycetes bacterium]|nr:HAMP domain-containing protein [Planctomycetota bacterium]
MSYRSFNRALGETSLELKCLFLFGVFLALVIAVSFLLYWRVTEEVVYEQNPNTARLLVDQGILIKHWEATERGAGYEDYSNFVTEYLSGKLTEQEYNWRFILPPDEKRTSTRVAPAKTEREIQLIKRFLAIPLEERLNRDSPQYLEQFGSDGDVYHYYQPVWAQLSCLDCHNLSVRQVDPTVPAGGDLLKQGDLMAVAHVSIPTDRTKAAVAETWNLLFAVSIITAFMALIAFYVVIRYVVVKPVRHLRQVSDAISRGNLALRADIHTGDEFEALAVAFNRMLRHLVNIQHELREANIKLDAKVDELAQANMQLYEMNRIKSDFLATMSHELRTPLNSILGFSDVLGSIDSLDDRQKRYVENIRKSGRMLLEMINNILDLAKIESGRMEIRLTHFSIAQVVSAQCDMARPLSENKNIDLTADIQPDLPLMYQDQARVQQILNNLLSNAIKFTPEGGRIKVTVRRNDKDQLVLQVSDTGVGIAEEDQQTIFEKFRQGRTAMPGGDAITREYSGTGLGLSIVRELCRLLGGDVSVESQLGMGSTFTVRLPWRLEKQPRLETPLLAGFQQQGRPPLEMRATATQQAMAAPTQAPSSDDAP